MLLGRFLTLFSVAGMPVRLHLLAPLVWLLFNRLDGARWVGVILIVFLHELGHAAIVRRLGARVVSIDFVPLGGECSWQGSVSKVGESFIAWGGVLAQAALLAVVWPLSQLGWVEDPFFLRVLSVLVFTNLFLIGLNLLPIPGLDGWRAWPLFPRWLRAVRARRANERHRAVTKTLEHLDKAPPADDEVKAAVKKLFDDARRDLKP